MKSGKKEVKGLCFRELVGVVDEIMKEEFGEDCRAGENYVGVSTFLYSNYFYITPDKKGERTYIKLTLDPPRLTLRKYIKSNEFKGKDLEEITYKIADKVLEKYSWLDVYVII